LPFGKFLSRIAGCVFIAGGAWLLLPTLVMQGEDDQVVPYKGAALLQVKLLKNPTLKLYPGFKYARWSPRRNPKSAKVRPWLESRTRNKWNSDNC
jgi:fermentation-respiration switch protein FrsA (DUF1100 family)